MAWGDMANPSSSPTAGGCLLAAAILLGALIGVSLGQPSIGILAGTAVGTAAALVVWLRDRARRR
jgi:hypothetical protein